MKKILMIITSLVILLPLLLCGCSSETPTTSTPATRIITDLIGRTVEIPDTVDKVATFVGPSYDKVFMLGEKDKVAMVGFPQSPWAQLLNPDLANIPTATNAKSPNIEELVKLDIDVVFTWDTAEPLQAMSNADIPALAALGSSTTPTSAEMYVDAMKKEVNLCAEVLGSDAQTRAAKYCNYLDSVIERVTSVTSKLADNEKPNVYYIRGPEVLSTHGKYSNTRWYVEMAGGNMVKTWSKVFPWSILSRLLPGIRTS
ncbi:MAG: ABC transporter substrate-binding protein [Syntrophomonadaceae bacterium]|nr:ABC transporter substrate-binding protein [Syntrophomonadaceae bacterium]